MNKKSIISTIAQHLGLFFMSGLLTLLPIALTFALFKFSFGLLKGWFYPLQETLTQTRFGYIPHIELIAVIITIFVIGILMQLFILRSVVTLIEEGIIFRIPLVRQIYGGIKQLTSAFNPHNKLSFKKTVLVEFPRVGVYSIGFVTGVFPAQTAPNADESFYNVFIPHTPNPTAGFLIVIPEKEVKVIDLTRQEAMALIISGGIIIPERLMK